MAWGLFEEEVGEDPGYSGEVNESEEVEDRASALISSIKFPGEPDRQKRIYSEEWMFLDEHGLATIGPQKWEVSTTTPGFG